MATLKPLRLGPCLGLNTISAPDALPVDPQTGSWQAARLVNLDVRDGGRRLVTRPGSIRAATGHWRDGYDAPDGRHYAVVDDVLCEVLDDLSTSPIVGLAVSDPVVWASLDANVYWSNGTEAGLLVAGVLMPWGTYTYPAASEAARFQGPPAGTVMCGFAGRVWIGVGSLLYFSTGDDAQFLDSAGGYLEMPAEITMLAPVDDGLYVGTTAGVWFLAGTDPMGGQQVTQVSPDAAVPHSAIAVRSDEVTQKYNPAGAVIWTSRRGIVVGLSGGIVLQPTKDNVALEVSPSYGAPALLDRRYVVVLHP